MQYQPHNATANYRLGLIAMLERDFPTAQRRLEAALAADPGHRGVQKVLGYCYVWMGEFEEAKALLVNIPESVIELEPYTGYWSSLGRPDLEARAREMRQILASGDF